ncbi:MAG: hypothetical protein KKE16_04215 [Firmicutes bacterium]|nr:hypothetical protein [Bacillota bacterium]
MKKFFANLVIFLSVLLITVVAIPWNNLGQWGLNISFLGDNELLVKGGIGGFLFLLGLVFLIVSIREYNYDGKLQQETANAAFLPMWLFSVAATAYAAILVAFIYTHDTTNQTALIYLGGLGFLVLNILGFGHLLSSGFKIRKNFSRIMIFVFLFEILLVSGGAAYYVRTYVVTNYASFYTYNYVLVGAVTFGFYILHLILLAVKKNRVSEEELLQVDYEPEMKQAKQQVEKLAQAPMKKAGKKQQALEQVDSRKTLIVSKDETIQSKGKDMDPTNMLYEDVSVDPEFSQTSNQSRQINSIDYYIEKPKMFKPLDPTFDLLVEYVRELPNVVTKIADEKITFYLDRNPFLVLINYGNYYRMAFKYELEKGIRLIIKYPTISKNKSTKDDLWFKANNYGDLPKEVIYQIVKSSYDQSVK